MSEIQKCKDEGQLTVDYMEHTLRNNRGSNAAITRRLVGMIVRGEGFTQARSGQHKATEEPAPASDSEEES